MTWVSFENFQFWGSRENWLLRQHGRNFVAGADNTALCSGNFCKFVQLVEIFANLCKLWNGNHIKFLFNIACSFHRFISICKLNNHTKTHTQYDIHLAKCANNGIEARWILFARQNSQAVRSQCGQYRGLQRPLAQYNSSLAGSRLSFCIFVFLYFVFLYFCLSVFLSFCPDLSLIIHLSLYSFILVHCQSKLNIDVASQ